MRNIRKGAEPKAWGRHRCQKHASFEGCSASAKQSLREGLISEQGEICCYCMQRIYPTWDGMKVEHWASQEDHPDKQMTYSNLLGACLGGMGLPFENQHCDTRKGKRALSRNPSVMRHNVEGVIRYLGDGRIESSDATFNTELETVLNLNARRLVNERRLLLEGFKASMPKLKAWPRPVLERKLAEWRGQGGTLRPFCQVIVYYLEKRLARGDA